MRSPLLGSLCVLLLTAIGCQATPLTWKNPFSRAVEPDLEVAASEKTQTEPAIKETAEVGRTRLKPIPEYTEEIDGSREPSPEEQLWTQAEEAFHGKNFSKATAFYREVVAQNPKHAEAHHRLGFLADQQSNYALAERHYQSAIRLDPRNLNYLNDLGMSYLLQQRYDESESIFNQLLQVDPQNALALQNLGSLNAKQGRLAEAFDYFRQSGFDRDESEQMVLSLHAEAGQPGAQPLQAQASRGDTGLPYDSPSPDWDSTYRLKREAQPESQPQITQTGNRRFPAEPNSQMMSGTDRAMSGERTINNPLRGNEFANSAQNVHHADYDVLAIEQAALNSGPGRLFPVTSAEHERATPRMEIAPTSYIDPLESQPAARSNYEQPRNEQAYEPNVRQNSGMSLQTPSNYAALNESAHSIPVSSAAQSPFTQNRGSYPAATNSQFDQFPTQTPAAAPTRTTSDPIREYQAELENNPFGPSTRIR